MQEINFPDAITKSQDSPHELFSSCHSGLAHLFYHPHTHPCLLEMNMYYLHCNSRSKSSVPFLEDKHTHLPKRLTPGFYSRRVQE